MRLTDHFWLRIVSEGDGGGVVVVWRWCCLELVEDDISWCCMAVIKAYDKNV